MPRTTVMLEDNAMALAKLHARRYHLTLGQAVSDLVRQKIEPLLVT